MAVITAEVSAGMVPAVAVNTALLLPDATVTLAGTVSSGELELSATGVFATAAWVSVNVQVVVPADISPVKLQVTELVIRDIEADCEELL